MRHMNKFGSALRRAGNLVLDTVLPPRCPVTGALVDEPGMLSPECWQGIVFITENCCSHCGRPFEIAENTGAVCGPCLDDPPRFDVARCAVEYNDASRNLILAFKYADQTYAIKTFTPWLLQCGKPILTDADMLVPVPLHRRRLWQRRFNQAALLASAVGRKSGVAARTDLLMRGRFTRPQGGLKRKERRKNVRGAFQLRPGMKDAVRGKTVVLVDDVYTTGATLNECTRALQKAGAAEVRCLCIARVTNAALNRAGLPDAVVRLEGLAA